VILSNEDQFTRLFTEKYKHIKFSLYLFTEDAGGRDGPFQRADQDQTVQRYLQFIDNRLIAKTNSIMSLIQLLQGTQMLKMPYQSTKPSAAFYLSLLNRLSTLLEF
jgi:hypothetical protein